MNGNSDRVTPVQPNAKDRQDPEGCTFALMIVQTREIKLNETHVSGSMTGVPLKKKHVGLEGTDM